MACPVVENQPHNGQVALFPGPAQISVARAQGEPRNKANGQVGGKVASVFACSKCPMEYHISLLHLLSVSYET